MMGHLKLGSAAVAAIFLAACSTTTTDDSMQVGVNDDDQFATTTVESDIELSDAQTFGINDDDRFDATTTTPDTAVAARVVRKNDTIAMASPYMTDYSTVYGAIGTAGLADTFDGDVEYTVFAPNNAAFSGMDLSGLSQAQLADTLKYHTVEGRISSADLVKKLQSNGGSYEVMTLSGEPIRFVDMDGTIKVADRNGYTYTVDMPDNEFRNGYIHGIDGVLGREY
ncbi:fasciclin domain-containing protein [uncultured Algimonas sp.]|uniref:fasciclin domain-containing protein n=1 Tax=uncultured Algimonas sp. TaxID=1547920 RepID=UPI00262B7A08|nr:fasciclin domain-containing protein [uncultured Algimonas sp.]